MSMLTSQLSIRLQVARAVSGQHRWNYV